MVGPASAELRRSLRPIDWVVLEGVALDVRPDCDGALVALTSVRRLAEQLGLSSGAVAFALTRLRSAGLVNHARSAGPAGRFGLSKYVLGPVPGLAVFDGTEVGHATAPSPVAPDTASPCVVEPHTADSNVAEPPEDAGGRPARPGPTDVDVPTPPPRYAGNRAAPQGAGTAADPRWRAARRDVVQLTFLDGEAQHVLGLGTAPE